jgi:hypothetical protein
MAVALPNLTPLPVSHFIWTAGVAGQFLLTVVFAVGFGIVGVKYGIPRGSTNPRKRAWIFRILFLFGAGVALWMAIDTAKQLRDADFDKRTNRAYIETIASTAQVPITQSSGQIVQGILGKLTVVSSASGILGSDNKTGVNAGAASNVHDNKIHIGDNNYFINSAGHRTISDAAKQQISADLAKSGPFTVNVVLIGSDPEVVQFGQQIEKIIRNAHWIANENMEISGVHDAGLLGLHIGVKDGKSPPAAANILLTAFKSHGVQVTGGTDNSIADSGAVNVIVGGRP